jgi:hypothetical protein
MPLGDFFVIAYNYQRFNCCTCPNSLTCTTYLRCANGTIVITTQTGLEYLNGTLYQASNTFSSLTPNNYTLYVRNIAGCMAISASATKLIQSLFRLLFQQ